MRNQTDRRDQHPEDSVLLKYLDCELTEREAEEVGEHLESCWNCRVRLEKLQQTISAFVEFRDQVFSAETSQPPRGFRGFSAQLLREVDKPPRRSFWMAAADYLKEVPKRFSSLFEIGGFAYPVAMVALLLAIAISFSVFRREKDALPSASSILAQAARAETIERNKMLKRTFIVEQKNASTGKVIRRRRIESWRNGSGQRASRVYDESNSMVRGSWVKADGTRVQYQKEKDFSATEEQLPAEENVWEVPPSASEFARLIGSDAQLSVQATPAVYIVGYSNRYPVRPRLKSATLTVRRGDLRAVAQYLVVEGRSSENEYKIEEVSFEQRTQVSADLKYFEPDFRIAAERSPEAPPASNLAPASMDDEVQLYAGLDSVGALVGEQLEVSRLPGGALRLHGLVPDSGRRREIIQALGPLAHSPSVRVEVSTVEEAQKRERPSKTSRVRLDQIEIAHTVFPAEDDLRSYLHASGLTGQRASDEVYRISGAVLERSAASRDHVIALRRIAGTFSPQDVKEMGGDTRAEWTSMVEKHVRGVAQSLRELRRDMGPVFGVLPVESEQKGRPDRSTDFWDAVAELDEKSSFINDCVRRSFTLRSEGANGPPVREREFWEVLDRAIVLADRVSIQPGN